MSMRPSQYKDFKTPLGGLGPNGARVLLFVFTLMKCVAPVSFAFLFLRILGWGRTLLPLSRKWQTVLSVYLSLEAAFYAYCLLWWSREAQKQPHPDKVVNMSPAERLVQFRRGLATVSSVKSYAECWFKSGHAFEDLRRENVREWMAWVFFHRFQVSEMRANELEELESLMTEFESHCDPGNPTFRMPEGKNEQAVLYKFNTEPVTYAHRPFIMYFNTHFFVQEFLAPLRFGMLGFQRMKEGNMYYFYKKLSEHKEPLVLIHGLGIGVITYDEMLQRFQKLVDCPTSSMYGRSIICLEVHVASLRIKPEEVYPEDFVRDVRAMVRKLGFTKCIFMGHSYGSFVLAWIIRLAPELLAACALLDPASVFLHYPWTLYSILYKQPEDALESCFHYMIRQDLAFNAHARRHFFWYANILYLEDIATHHVPVMIVLSDDDMIVPVNYVREYVNKYNKGHRLHGAKDADGKSQVDLIWLDQCQHGAFLWLPHHAEQVVNGIERLSDKLER